MRILAIRRPSTRSAVNRRFWNQTSCPSSGIAPKQTQHQPADRVPLLVGKLDVQELVDVVDRELAVHAVDAVGDLLDLGLLGVVLVRDLADELLEQVLERDEAADAPVLVGDERDVELLLLHLAEQVGDPLGLGDEVRFAHGVGERQVVLALVQRLQDVLGVDDADGVDPGRPCRRGSARSRA